MNEFGWLTKGRTRPLYGGEELTDPRREAKANDSLPYAGHRHRSVIDCQSDFGSQPD